MPKKKEPGRYKPLHEMSLFELSISSVMPRDVYSEIRRRLELALIYMGDGAPNTAKDILERFLNTGGKR
jgi:hypothetical protein